MIEKMKAVCVAAQAPRREELLLTLRELGILHLAEKRAADPGLYERFAALSGLMRELKDYRGKGDPDPPSVTDEELESLFQRALSLLKQKSGLVERLAGLRLEEERLKPWGDFDPRQWRELAQTFQLHICRVDKKTLQTVRKEGYKFIRLSPVEKMETLVFLGDLAEPYRAAEFIPPEKGLSQLRAEEASCERQIAECDRSLRECARYEKAFADLLVGIRNDVEFSAADRSIEGEDGLVFLTGYIPSAETEKLSAAAKAHNFAWMAEEVEEDDGTVPTKVRYNRLTALIKPLFDILGTVPGYREYDISFWFLGFFTLFFAMIIGDAGYGVLFLLGTAVLHIRMRRTTNVILLLYLLSGATVVWGALTGTWFGLEGAMKIPFLKALVIPEFANYPEYFGLSASDAQNSVMKFCFSIGVIQLALACVMSIRRKICGKNLGWVADLGWLFSICALYFMVLNLVIGQPVSLIAVGSAVGAGFVLVVLFGGMEPGKTFGQGLKAGVGNAFTVFLNTISAFGNVMSYIRLFAVGMASLAIAQSFNDMASGFSGALVIVGIVIMVVGHALNIVMGFLSVVVHGVRLNLLEFSGQLGMEWSGIAYEPFREYKKNQK